MIQFMQTLSEHANSICFFVFLQICFTKLLFTAAFPTRVHNGLHFDILFYDTLNPIHYVLF